jgi:peptide/nickel transport system ATP-binding protein
MSVLLDVHELGVDHVRGNTTVPLVSGVSFTVRRGESVALVGESGSGKTLTARSLVSLLAPGLRATGSITFDGAAIGSAGATSVERGRRIALLMQDPFTMLNPMMTAGAHIAETLAARHGRKGASDAEVARRLAEVGITDPAVARRYPFELSGGMSQRVAVAAALANDPELLVADEPTTALDATTQREVLELLRGVQQARGMGLVLITHDLRLAFSVCDRVLVMYAGSIVEVAPSAELREAPRHPYTAGLLGSMPSIERYQPVLTGIGGSVPSLHAVADRCAFADRCRHRTDECVASAPPLVEIEPGRWTACRRVHELEELLDVEVGGGDRPTVPVEREPVLSVTDLHKAYRSGRHHHVALGSVSFELGRGEALGVVGESGSGKTTIARCVLGLTSPTSGRIVLDGIDVTSRRAIPKADRVRATQRLQCVFQDPYSTLNPMHSVGYAIREALAHRARPVDQVEAKVTELLELVGLPGALASRRPAALSGGQRQRVAIARALAMDPEVLVCDEPVAALDVSVQAQVLDLLRSLHRDRGTSLLFITHDLGVVRQVTDRIIVLHRGEIVEEGATDVVLDRPQHPYTQRLVASMPRIDTEWMEV